MTSLLFLERTEIFMQICPLWCICFCMPAMSGGVRGQKIPLKKEFSPTRLIQRVRHITCTKVKGLFVHERLKMENLVIM